VELTDRLEEKMAKMIRFSKKVANGDFDHEVAKTEVPEIDELVHHLNKMTAELRLRDEKLNDHREALAKANRDLKSSLVVLKEMQAQLNEASRRAGMAEIASGVLHNVGNVLNSVNVSVQLAADKLGGSELPGLRRAVDLLDSNADDLLGFFGSSRGTKLVKYLSILTEQLEKEHSELTHETIRMEEGIKHIKMIVSKQQEYATRTCIVEKVTTSQLISEASHLAVSSFASNDIDFIRNDDPPVEVTIDRHAALQIMVNLLTNAKQALNAVDKAKKTIKVDVNMIDNDRFSIKVEDNGIGISEENQAKLFIHGFTTKKNGHGFGLHDSANAAIAMGGSLTFESAGEGRGATFTLELPRQPLDEQGEIDTAA
jgi:signal transduction histidine kinase